MFVVAIYEVPFPEIDPVLPPFFPGDHGLKVISHFQDFGPTYEYPPPLDLVSLGLTPSIATILNSVQHVSQLVPAWHGYPTAATHLVMLTRMCTLLSHLLSLAPITGLSVPNPESEFSQISALVSESARFAILLHVFTAWRGLPPDGTLTINHLMHQLIACLKALLSITNYSNNCLLLWIVAVGGVSAFNMPERAWFVSHLAEMTEEMGIGNWEEMKAGVSRGIWHERLAGRSHQKLWEEVDAKRRVAGGVEELVEV
jgi:Fungal specific transcription factor domain